MKLLYVLRYWPTRSETFVVQEIAGLRARGHEVVVAAIGTRSDGVGLDPVPGIEVWRPPRGLGRVPAALARRRVEGGHGAAVATLLALQRPKDVDRACALALWASEQGIDRVHAHFAGEAAEWARLVAAVCGLPYSVTAHASDLFRPRPGLAALLADARPAITVCAHHVRWIRDRHGVEAREVRCGVDPSRFRPVDRTLRPVGPGPHEPLRVVAVARWTPKKGLDTLLDALHLIDKPTPLRLIGDAPDRVARAGVRVGPLDPEEVPAALQKADLFVLPCRVAPDGDRDGVPVALMEAMAAGLPVVSTAVSGVPELVDASVGWLVPPDDPAALAAVLDLARDPEARRVRGLAGRRRILDGWTLDAQVSGLLDAWGAA